MPIETQEQTVSSAALEQPYLARRQNWTTHLARHALMQPDATALRFVGQTVTWGQLEQRVTKLAGALSRRGVGFGDRVLILMLNRAFSADLIGHETILQKWPPPYAALDWILRNRAAALPGPACDLAYVIESDMIHYDVGRLAEAEAFLRTRPDVGAVRCMEYSVADRRLYDKSSPVPGGRRWAW